MAEHPVGSLHDKVDVKVLILFILARIDKPLSVDEIYEVAFQDDSLNYFVLAESVPELKDSGHLKVDEKGRYSITEMGRKQGSYVEDSLARALVLKVTDAIRKKNDQIRRDGYLSSAVTQDENGYWIATLNYHDDKLPLMTLSLMAPNEPLGEAMIRNMKKQIDVIYKTCVDIAIDANKDKGTRS